MSRQEALFAPTQHGEQIVPIAARLHARVTDPETSLTAAVEILVGIEAQKAEVFRLLQRKGPSSSNELAAGLPADFRYTVSRRLPDLEVDGVVTCDRVKDERGRTVCVRKRKCRVTGRMEIEWRAR